VDGFQTGISVAGKNVHLIKPKLIGPSTSGSTCLTMATGSDELRVFGGSLVQCALLFSHDAASIGTAFFTATTFIEAKGGATPTYVSQTVSERIFFVNCHWAALTTAPLFLNQTTGRTFIIGGAFEDDRVSGALTSYATVSGGFVDINGMDISTSGETATEFVLFSGSAVGHFSANNNLNPAQIPLLWNTAYAGGPVTEEGTDFNGSAVPFTDFFTQRSIQPQALTFAGNLANPSTSAATVYNQSGVGPTVNGNTFQVRTGSGTPVNTFQVNSANSIEGLPFVADKGAACTNGELALSAGWQLTGSATPTAVQGTTTCSWTITTGTTTGANPTITDTLTNPLPNATTVCEMNIHGGTHTAAAGEYFQQTTLSATAPVFTANFTPTAGGTTYFVTRRCGP